MMFLMELNLSEALEQKRQIYKKAGTLAFATISFNLIVGYLSVSFGIQDGTLALTGFGLYSIVEVIAGLGLWRAVTRMRRNIIVRGNFEDTVLKIAGWGFLVLSAALSSVSVVSILVGTRPETTFWGVVMSLLCVPIAWNFADIKTKMGKSSKCGALMADANRAASFMQLSTALFISSISFEATRAGILDSLGMAAVAVLSYRESKKTFERVRPAAETRNETVAPNVPAKTAEIEHHRAA